MKSCFRIPRLLLPQKQADMEKWAVISAHAFSSDRSYWERISRIVGNTPSTLGMILPAVYLGEEDEERQKEIRENMYAALETDTLEKFVRGFVLTVRETAAGLRRGIVAAIDLEDFTSGRNEMSPIRPASETDAARVQALLKLRRSTPIELAEAVVLYRDKRDRVIKSLKREDLERVYDFDLMEGGGHIAGFFLPEYISQELILDLNDRSDPCFAVAEGGEAVAAAKAHWDEVKLGLSLDERKNHPARFCLVELQNLCDDAVELLPVHRLVTDIDAEAFCDFFTRAVKCKRKGHLLYPALAGGAEAVTLVDGLIEKFVRANTGRVKYLCDEEEIEKRSSEEGCVGVVLKGIDKDDLFARLKGGGVFPKNTFSLGGEQDKRYYIEGREISYD